MIPFNQHFLHWAIETSSIVVKLDFHQVVLVGIPITSVV